MRKIEFRGQRLDTKEWVYGCLLITELKGNLEPLHYYICPIKNKGMHRVIPETVGQYTGLTDKNGKEIYEGDVLEFYDFHGVVKFGLHSDLVYNGWYVETMNGQCELNESFQFTEVIGNIHGNQELLEKVFNRR